MAVSRYKLVHLEICQAAEQSAAIYVGSILHKNPFHRLRSSEHKSQLDVSLKDAKRSITSSFK